MTTTVGLGRVCLRCQGSFIDIPWRPGAAYCCGPMAGAQEPSWEPMCDTCGVLSEDNAAWCGSCGMCADHCRDWEGC